MASRLIKQQERLPCDIAYFYSAPGNSFLTKRFRWLNFLTIKIDRPRSTLFHALAESWI